MSILTKLLDSFKGKEEVEPAMQVLFDSGTKTIRDEQITLKDDRSNKVTYDSIGRTEYGSGQPPELYSAPLNAVKSFPTVYGCVTAISEAVSALGVKVYKVNGGEREEVTDHPFYALFSKPNPYQGSYEFMEELEQQLDVFGNVFVAIEKVAGTYELYLLNPQYVAIIPDSKVKVKEYRYYINGNFVAYKAEEIIHIKYTDLDDPYYGQPPLNVASDILKFEENRLTFANQFFQNGAIPAGVLETEQNLGDQLLRKLRYEWSGLHKGVKNSHKVAILQGGLTYKPIASPLKDLDFSALKKLSRDDILTIFKVPSSVIGDQTSIGSDEGKGALTAFWRGVVVPRLKRVESAFNRGLTEVFGDGQYVFEFNLKDVVALQEDKTEQAQYLERMVSCSVMTPNEARAVLGLPKSKDPTADMLMVSNSFYGNQLMPASMAEQQGAGSNTEKPTVAPAKEPAKEPAPAPEAPTEE